MQKRKMPLKCFIFLTVSTTAHPNRDAAGRVLLFLCLSRGGTKVRKTSSNQYARQKQRDGGEEYERGIQCKEEQCVLWQGSMLQYTIQDVVNWEQMRGGDTSWPANTVWSVYTSQDFLLVSFFLFYVLTANLQDDYSVFQISSIININIFLKPSFDTQPKHRSKLKHSMWDTFFIYSRKQMKNKC